MPFYTDDAPPDLRLPTGGALPNPDAPSAGQAVGAAFRQDNTIVNLARRLFDEQHPIQEGHNPLDLLGRESKYAEFYLDRFTGSRSAFETNDIRRRIDQEEEDRKLLDAAGGDGVALSIAASIADPLIFLPAGEIAVGLRAGRAAGQSAVRVGGAAGLQTAAQEGILQATQETRTAAESAINIGAATLLGGIIGGGASALLSRAEREVLTATLERERADMAAHATGRAPEPPAETIRAPAVMAKDGTIFTDANHGLAAARAEEAGYELAGFLDANGFMTSTGRFVSRREANAIADAAAQVNEEKVAVGDALTAHRLQGFDNPPLTPRQYVSDYVAGKADTPGHREFAAHRADAIQKEMEERGIAGAAAAPSETPAPSIVPPIAPARAASLGAAAERTDELIPVSYGFDKLPGWSRFARLLGTDLGIYSSSSVAARRTASELFETTLRFRQNIEGEVTSPIVPLDREVRTLIETTRNRVSDEIHQSYSDYFFGAPDTKLPYVRAEFALRTGQVEGKLSPDQFDREVATAMHNGDTHAIPQVQRVAQFLRANVFEPFAQRMQAVNPDFKMQEFKPGSSYFPYSWDTAKVAAERPDFVERTVLPHLQADQAQKAAAKERLQTLADDLRAREDEIAKFEARLERMDARAEEVATRLDERAMEVRKAEQRAGVLEERAASIEEELSEVEDFIRAMREQVRDPQMLARLDAMEKDAAALRRADRSVTEADLRRIEQEEQAGILTGTARLAAEMVIGKRAFPRPPSFISWIVSQGGVADAGGDVKFLAGGTRGRPGLLNKGGIPLDRLAERIQEEAPGLFPRRDEPGGGAPAISDVLDWIGDAMRGREPGWWAELHAAENENLLAAGKLARAMDEVFARAGLSPRRLSEVTEMFRRGRRGDVSLADLDRIAGEMEAAGEAIPASMRRAAAEENVSIAREDIAEVRGLIQRAMRAREAGEGRLRVAEGRGEEAGIAERRNVGRLGILQERLDAAEMRRALLNDMIELSGTRRDRVRRDIEKELGAWEGKSAAEAKSALKAREKYEDLRRARRNINAGAEIPQGEAVRLTSADSSVDAVVRRILASDRDLTIDELRDKAEEIADHVLGTPIGRIPYDMAQRANEGPRRADRTARGPLLERDFAVPYGLAKDWLSHDLNRVLGSWMRTMVPDALLWERFPGEGPAMTSRYRQIQEDYSRLSREAKSAKERTRLNKEKDAVIATLDGVLQRIRGTTNNTEGLSGRVAEVIRRGNQMTDLGFAAVTSIPDFAGPIFYHGLTSVFKDGWLPFFKYLSGDGELAKMSKAELRSLNIGLEIENSTRGHAFAEISEVYHPRTQAERVLKAASDRFFLLNLQAPETDAAKRVAGRVAMSNFLRAVKAEAEGKATQKQVVALRESNIDAAMSKRIWDQFSGDGGGATIDGTLLPNTANWADERAKMHFMAAIGRDVDRAVVTPGQEKPLWLSGNAGSLLGQFKSFSVASGNKVLISNLQRHDAQSLQGIVSAVAMGVLSYRITTLIRGDKWPDRPQDAIKEGISRSGILGPLEDLNMFASKASRGQVDMYRMIGADKPLSRNVNRTILSSLLGPTAGKIENIAKVTGALGSGEWSAADTHAARRLMFLQNLVGLNRAFDQAEKGFNSFFDIPERAERR